MEKYQIQIRLPNYAQNDQGDLYIGTNHSSNNLDDLKQKMFAMEGCTVRIVDRENGFKHVTDDHYKPLPPAKPEKKKARPLRGGLDVS